MHKNISITQQCHPENPPMADKQPQDQCSKCSHIGKFSIHHKHYKQINNKSIYDYSFDELDEMEVVEVLCYTCHKKEHIGDNVERCYYCNLPTGIDRTKCLTVPVIVCRKCFKKQGGIKGVFTAKNNQSNFFDLFDT